MAIATVCIATVCFSSYKAYDAYRITTDLDSLLSENTMALSQDEYIKDCVRKESNCTVEIGVKGSIRLLGGTIIQAGADGKVSFDGQVTCSTGGDTYCRPVECIELYTTVLQ